MENKNSTHILFVCLGNICRSPLAEGIMRRLFEENDLVGKVESAATSNYNIGCRADARSISVAKQNGIDLSKHRARQISKEDFEEFDIIFVMDNANLIALRKVAPSSHHHKIKLVGGDIEVVDPYYSNEAAFHSTYKQLEGYCRKLLSELPGR